jgi:hypothetical protein
MEYKDSFNYDDESDEQQRKKRQHDPTDPYGLGAASPGDPYGLNSAPKDDPYSLQPREAPPDFRPKAKKKEPTDSNNKKDKVQPDPSNADANKPGKAEPPAPNPAAAPNLPGLPTTGGEKLSEENKLESEKKVGNLDDATIRKSPRHNHSPESDAFTVGRRISASRSANKNTTHPELGHFEPRGKGTREIGRKPFSETGVERKRPRKGEEPRQTNKADAKRAIFLEQRRQEAQQRLRAKDKGKLSPSSRTNSNAPANSHATKEPTVKELQQRYRELKAQSAHRNNAPTNANTTKEQTIEELQQRYRKLKAQSAQRSSNLVQTTAPADSAPLFPVKPDVKLATTAIKPGMFFQSNPQNIQLSATQNPAPQKLAQNVQQRVSSSKPLAGDALKIEALRQTFGCSPAVAQQLLKARRQTGKIDGISVMPGFEMPSFLSSTPQYQYNVNLSQSEYAWYFKYVNSPSLLRDIDLDQQTQQQQNYREILKGSQEQQTALKTHTVLNNRGNYSRLQRSLNQEKRGQNKVPTDLKARQALLSPAQAAIYERKLQSIQRVYGDQPVSEYVRQGVLDQVQFETRLDVMEIYGLGRSLDDKRRQRLENLYDGKSEDFKDKAEQSVSAGFKERWGIDPVFGQETTGKVKRVMRDRYLIQSDRRAMEIAYLGRPLSAQQRKAAEAFYEKLSPAQQREYSQKSRAEYELMWGNEPPHPAVMGQIKWVLRAQQMERDYAGQIYRGAEQTQQPKQMKKDKPAAISTEKGVAQSPKEPKGLFDAEFAERYYQTLYTQGVKEQNGFKFFAGHIGAGTAGLYRAFTGTAEQGVKNSLELAHQGQAEGGLSGGLKTVLGYGLTFIPSQFTKERAPESMMGVAAVPALGAGAATQFGKAVLANPVVQKAVLPTLGLGGAAVSGKQMGDAATGKDLLTGDKLNEEERVSRGGQGVLGVAGSFSLLEDTGKNIINGAKGIPATVKGLGQKSMGGSPEVALPNGGKVNPADELNPNQLMRSQGNNRSSGKGKGKDTPIPQKQSPWRQPLPERLTTPNGNPIPYGFKSFEEYQAYGKFLRTEAPEGTAVFFQGSSVTGRNSKTGMVFDVGRRSDFDVALANQSIFNRARQLGYKAKDGTRIGPLNEQQLKDLGLLEYARKARESSGRETEFMLFDTSKSARTRPSIEVLLEEEGL